MFSSTRSNWDAEKHIPDVLPSCWTAERREKSNECDPRGHESDTDVFVQLLLLAARKVPKANRQTKYVISTDVETLSAKSGGDGAVGKLRGNNLLGTEYTLYDNGVEPKKFKSSLPNDRTGLRRELAAIVYVRMKCTERLHVKSFASF